MKYSGHVRGFLSFVSHNKDHMLSKSCSPRHRNVVYIPIPHSFVFPLTQ